MRILLASQGNGKHTAKVSGSDAVPVAERGHSETAERKSSLLCIKSHGIQNNLHSLGTAVTAHGFVNHGGSFSRQKVLEVDRKLKHLRRHSLKAIQSEDGDIIDCVDIIKQPSFDHPALKDHKIQMASTNNSTKEDTIAWTRTRSKTKAAKWWSKGPEDSLSLTVTSQVWQKSGRYPEGTIPIRRIRRRDLLKAHSIEEY